jgi:hypothetical protein
LYLAPQFGHAAGHGDLYAIEHHRTRGDRDRLQARRALPISGIWTNLFGGSKKNSEENSEK